MKYIKGGIVVMAINFEEVKTKFINGDLDRKNKNIYYN